MSTVPFANLFTHAALKENYLQYLKQSYQSEPFCFLLDVREYKENPSLEKAKTITSTYISDNTSTLEINIDRFTKDELLHALEKNETDPNMFDKAYK